MAVQAIGRNPESVYLLSEQPCPDLMHRRLHITPGANLGKAMPRRGRPDMDYLRSRNRRVDVVADVPRSARPRVSTCSHCGVAGCRHAALHWNDANLPSLTAQASKATTIFPFAEFASLTRCASRISSNLKMRDGFAL
jgi:hypothetical protein